jgi:iron complex outermembrane recepter protein
VAGLTYLSNDAAISRSLPFPELGLYRGNLTNRLSETTAFGEVSFRATPSLLIAVGGRLSNVSISGAREDQLLFFEEPFRVAVLAERNETIASPSASAVYTIAPNWKAYARFQRGYRPGGLGLETENVVRFENDQLDLFEAGIKFGRGRSSLVSGQIAVSYSRWRDIQADLADGAGFPITENIGNGFIKTFQVNVAVTPSERLKLDASLLLNWSRLDEPAAVLFTPRLALNEEILRGRASLPNVADVSARLGFSYIGELGTGWTWDLNGSLRYTGRSRLGIGPRFDKEQGGFVQSNLFLRFRKDNSSIFLSASNLANDRTSRFGVGNPFEPDVSGQYVPQRPRSLTIGFETAF